MGKGASSRWSFVRRHQRVEPIVIAGAGGFSREVAQTIAAINAVRPTWELLGFVDDDPSLIGASVGGVEVIGPVELLQTAVAHAKVVVCTGRPANYFSRPMIVQRLGLPPWRYATL